MPIFQPSMTKSSSSSRARGGGVAGVNKEPEAQWVDAALTCKAAGAPLLAPPLLGAVSDEAFDPPRGAEDSERRRGGGEAEAGRDGVG